MLSPSIRPHRAKEDTVAVALRVELRTPADELDPSTALTDLRAVLALLRDIEADLELADASDLTAWRFQSLEVGSLRAEFVPRDAGSAARRRAASAGLRLVRGFAEAQTEAAIPEAWSLASARRAKNIAGHLGEDLDRGLLLRLIVDGSDEARADITATAAANLRSATKATHDSIGSVVGTIGSVTIHGRNRAGLWPERGPRVDVQFDKDRLNEISNALGRRVQVAGLLERNARGQLLRVRLRRLEILPTLDADQPSGLAGVYPDITGGRSAVEHVAHQRDPSRHRTARDTS